MYSICILFIYFFYKKSFIFIIERSEQTERFLNITEDRHADAKEYRQENLLLMRSLVDHLIKK